MNDPRRQLMAAHAAFVRGEPEQALALAGQVLAARPQQVDALQLYAGAALRLGRAEDAAQALRRAREHAPANLQVLFNLAIAEQAAGRHAAAAETFRAFLDRQPGHADALLGLAQAAQAAGDTATAIETWRRLLAADVHADAAGDELAVALADAGDFAAAQSQARAALAAAPDRAESWRTLARVLERAGRPGDAVAVLDEAVKQVVDGFPLLMAKGHLAHRADRIAIAARAFADAARLRPQSADAWNNLAACQVRLDRIEDAIAAARRACALVPGDAGVRMTLAAALSHGRDPQQLAESLALAQAVLAQAPKRAIAHDCIALVQLKLGNADAAENHARQAVAIDPDNGAFAVTLSRVLEQKGDFAGAEAALLPRLGSGEAAGAPAPTVLRQLGHVRLLRGNAHDAFAPLDAAWRGAPGDQTAIAERALALGANEGWEAAASWLGLCEWVRTVPIATPAGFASAPEFLRALADDIRGHSTLRFEPVGLVAKGGYLTGDLLADRTPAIEGFAASLTDAIARFIDSLPDVPGHPFLGQVPRGEHLMHVWATRVREQGVIDTHIHEGSWLSGAFYVELPPALNDDDSGGWIEFGRPLPGLPGPPDRDLLRLRPRAGQMLFFPSYVFHRTLPYRGGGERISISFDLAAR